MTVRPADQRRWLYDWHLKWEIRWMNVLWLDPLTTLDTLCSPPASQQSSSKAASHSRYPLSRGVFLRLSQHNPEICRTVGMCALVKWVSRSVVFRIDRKVLTPQVCKCNLICWMEQHSTAQHSTVQYSTVEHSTVQHSTAQHSIAQHSTA